MQKEESNLGDSSAVSLSSSTDALEGLTITGHYDVECIGEDGNVKWTDAIENIIVAVGKIDMFTKYFAGTAYSAAWYMGLVNNTPTPAYVVGDTLASHAGWAEFTSYSGANRIAVAFVNAPTGTTTVTLTNSTATSFSINGSGTLAGCLLCQTQVRATTTGVLYSVGSFTGGTRAVVSGDTVNVTFSTTLT